MISNRRRTSTGIEKHEWARLLGGVEAILLMGLLRNVAQGSKPDFIFLGKTTYGAHEVLKMAPHAEHHNEHKTVFALPPETTMEELRMRSPARTHSPALRATIALLISWVNAHELSPRSTIVDISKMLFS